MYGRPRLSKNSIFFTDWMVCSQWLVITFNGLLLTMIRVLLTLWIFSRKSEAIQQDLYLDMCGSILNTLIIWCIHGVRTSRTLPLRMIFQQVSNSNWFNEISTILSATGSAKIHSKRTLPVRTILIFWLPNKFNAMIPWVLQSLCQFYHFQEVWISVKGLQWHLLQCHILFIKGYIVERDSIYCTHKRRKSKHFKFL